MSTKAKLIVILKAGDTTVAEVENPSLWHQVLGVINQDSADASAVRLENHSEGNNVFSKTPAGTGVSRFAKTIGVTENEAAGALNPSRESPFLHLDRHCWAALKKGTGQRGPNAMNPTAVAGTLLALWLKSAGLDVQATQALAQEVLDTIDIVDKNPSRGVKNAKWLQGRAGGVIVINAAEISKAQEIARSFCTKKWPGTSQNA